MKLFVGLDSSDYQDVLRAVGLLLDQRGLRHVRLLEHQDGLIVQGRDDASGGRYQTFLLTDDDIRDLVHQASGRRGTGPLRPALTGD